MSKKKKPIQSFMNGIDYLRTVRENNDAFFDYLNRITKIASSIFIWKNLPKSMDGEYLELCLFWYGQASILKDDNKGGIINLKCATAGDLNIYGLPTRLNCYSYGYNKVCTVYNNVDIEGTDLCIHVLNNRMRIPTVFSIERYCDMLAEADLTSFINVQSQKTPVLLLGNKNQILTLKNLYAQYQGNAPVIFGDKDNLNLESIRVLKTDAPFVAKDIMDYKKEIWNEMLTFLGVNNIVTDKRERQIKDEVNANNELININLKNSLITRQKACEQMNKLYKLTGENEVKVELNSDLKNVLKEVLSDVRELQVDLLESDLDVASQLQETGTEESLLDDKRRPTLKGSVKDE